MAEPAIPSWPIPETSWHPEVRAWLAASPGVLRVIALSGGADSVALAASVAAEARAKGAPLLALHFNHCLRGAESDADEQWVRDLCDRWQIPLRTGRWQHAGGAASEGRAREARFAFFAENLAGGPTAALFTGHHADDVVETLLMRLSRGAGAGGLAAPRPVQSHAAGPVRLRPLLHLSRALLQGALRAAGQGWREDSTNAGEVALRNRLRHGVVENWIQASDRDVRAGVLRSRSLLAEDDEALEALTTALLGEADLSAPELKLAALRHQPRALVRRALHRWAPAEGLSADGFERLLDACLRGEGSVSLSRGIAVADGACVRVRQAGETVERAPVALRPGGGVEWIDGVVTYDTCAATPELLARILSGAVDARQEAWLAAAPEAVTVRHWAAGDRFAPLGHPGSAKLQDLFVNARVPLEKRHRIPIACAPGGEVLWVPGFPPAEQQRVTNATRVLGRLTYLSGTLTVKNQSP
ncbi:tRNA lysidine(34) synthetase TilS [Nibricoccus sp. IMCC34717]|uniref:tRNA lysidine(34) synthetase TilS n=1 Tax=Nibricoccus sp. IMCC34717 TaxID=3034021 RepID=UPI00384DB553